MGQCLGDKQFHVHCRHHKCDLDEIEHYEDWMLHADLSGFACPGTLDGDGHFLPEQFDLCDWAVSPIGRDDVNVFDLLPKKEK